MAEFNPNSFDAQFATVLSKLDNMSKQHEKKDEEDKVAYALIMSKQDKTNGRVTGLEQREQFQKGKIAGIALVVSLLGTFAGILLSK